MGLESFAASAETTKVADRTKQDARHERARTAHDEVPSCQAEGRTYDCVDLRH